MKSNFTWSHGHTHRFFFELVDVFSFEINDADTHNTEPENTVLRKYYEK